MTNELYIKLTHLKNDQHFQLFSEFGGLVSTFGPEALKIAPLFIVWEGKYQLEDDALKKINKSAITVDINDADARRNLMFRGLAGTCKISSIHYIDEIKIAAKPLQLIFDTYGNLAKKPLTEKTSAIFNLLQELRMHETAVKTAGLDGWMKELNACNVECRELMQNRWDESASRTKIVMKEARADVDAAYEVIMRRILALREVEGTEIYDKFLSRLGAVIDTYNAALARRSKNAKDDGNTESESTKE